MTLLVMTQVICVLNVIGHSAYLKEGSTTFLQSCRLRDLRKPPNLDERFSITGPSMSI